MTRQRNALSALMTDSNNLHLVKLELSDLEEHFAEYRKSCESHIKKLIERRQVKTNSNRTELKTA